MIRLHIITEGYTEQNFVENVLKEKIDDYRWRYSDQKNWSSKTP